MYENDSKFKNFIKFIKKQKKLNNKFYFKNLFDIMIEVLFENFLKENYQFIVNF